MPGYTASRSRTQALTCRLAFFLSITPFPPSHCEPLTAFPLAQQCRDVSSIHGLTVCTPHSTDMICVDSRVETATRPGRQPPHMPLFIGKPERAVDPKHRTAGRSPVPGPGVVCLLGESATRWSAKDAGESMPLQPYETLSWEYPGIADKFSMNTSSRLVPACSEPNGRGGGHLSRSPCHVGQSLGLGSTPFPFDRT